MNRMKIPYNQDYTPPAPTVEIWLAAPGESLAVGPIEAFIDSGADVTLIPRQHLRPLHLKALRRKTLRSQWGERRTVDVYIVEIGIGENLRLPWVEAVADEIGNELVLGRSALNKIRVLLDGPRESVEISA